MQEQLNNLYTLTCQLLNALLSEWEEELAHSNSSQDDDDRLALLKALLSIRNQLRPLLGSQQDTSHV